MYESGTYTVINNMADRMEDLKLTVNQDFAKKLQKQKEKAELDNCKQEKNFFGVQQVQNSRLVSSEHCMLAAKIEIPITWFCCLFFAVKQKFGDKYLDEESESSSSESEDDDARVSEYINFGN